MRRARGKSSSFSLSKYRLAPKKSNDIIVYSNDNIPIIVIIVIMLLLTVHASNKVFSYVAGNTIKHFEILRRIKIIEFQRVSVLKNLQSIKSKIFIFRSNQIV